MSQRGLRRGDGGSSGGGCPVGFAVRGELILCESRQLPPCRPLAAFLGVVGSRIQPSGNLLWGWLVAPIQMRTIAILRGEGFGSVHLARPVVEQRCQIVPQDVHLPFRRPVGGVVAFDSNEILFGNRLTGWTEFGEGPVLFLAPPGRRVAMDDGSDAKRESFKMSPPPRLCFWLLLIFRPTLRRLRRSRRGNGLFCFFLL